MKEIKDRLLLIKMSLTDSIDNPNFYKNREFALKKLTEVEIIVDSDCISNINKCYHQYVNANSPHGECEVCLNCDDVI